MNDKPSRRVSNRKLNRRSVLAAGMAGAALLLDRRRSIAWAAEQANAQKNPPTITDIEVHEIMVPYEDWIAYELNHYYGPTRRKVCVVHTNRGLVGLGEGDSREPDDLLAKYQGTSPFDWIGDETSLGLGTAMYDLM